ncbi:MAG: polysaccharide biosynthesis protein [Acidobacteria bacterium]|nr:polysaccharide biosynthesis protein [Acidobacteriota bacterium]
MLAASWLAMLIFYDVPQARHGRALANPAELRPHFSAQRLQSLAARGLPLGVVMLLISLQANIPRYVVERQLGEGDLGIFAALAAFMVAGNAVVNALGQSALPRLAVYAAGDQRREFWRLVGRLLAVAAGLGMISMGVAWVAGRPLLALIYSEEYAAHANTFLWLMAAAAASYFWSFLGVTLTALQEFRLQMFLQAAAAALCAILSIGLVQRFGLPGAGFAMFATMLFGMASYAIVLGRRFGLPG